MMITIDMAYDELLTSFTSNGSAHWQVLLGVTRPELDILDIFEDVEYERRAVDVSLMVSTENHLVLFNS